MATRNKNQHWVPQSYLDAWIDPATPENYEGYVHLFNRDGTNHRRRAPANIMAMSELYTIFNGTERDLRIEDAFSNWEGEFVKARRKLLAGQSITSEDLTICYVFAGAMMARPVHHIEFMRGQFAGILEKARSIRIDPQAPPMKSLTSGKGMTLGQFQKLVEDPMGTWFPDTVAANINVLSERFGCDILLNKSEHPFLTSDAPAVTYHPPRDERFRNMPRGLGWPGCEVTLPIAPTIALLFRHAEPGLHKSIDLDWEGVFELNFRTITRAKASIVSDRDDIFFVKTINDRVAEVEGGGTNAP